MSRFLRTLFLHNVFLFSCNFISIERQYVETLFALLFLLKACKNFSQMINKTQDLINNTNVKRLFFGNYGNFCSPCVHLLAICWPVILMYWCVIVLACLRDFYCAQQHLAATQEWGNTYRSVFNVAVAHRQLRYSVNNWRNIRRAVQLDLGKTVLVRLDNTLNLWWKEGSAITQD